jgi:diaminopimelate decarboxylase
MTPAPGEPETLAPRVLGEAAPGDIVVLEGSGAYCSGMCTKNYNSFPEAGEVMIANGKVHVIRQRQPVEQIWANEVPLPAGTY